MIFEIEYNRPDDDAPLTHEELEEEVYHHDGVCHGSLLTILPQAPEQFPIDA